MVVETEIKAELPDYPSYLKIYSSLGMPSKHLLQENFYYDSADRYLHLHGVMFRLRKEDNKKTFCVKFATTIENGIQKSREEELSVSEEEFDRVNLKEILFRICKIELPSQIELKSLGSILNNRAVFSDFFGASLELDHMQIFDQHFFEIEVETNTPEYHREKIKELLQNNQLSYKPSCSKYKRFLNLLQH